MPIYEFYCGACNTVYNFFSRRVDTATVPPCPDCRAPLSREISRIAFLSGQGDGGEDGLGDVPIDESRMEQAMEAMAGDFERMGESEDPRQAADLMRKFSDLSGLRFNSEIEGALERMAEGADPDAVGAELDAMMEDGADPFVPEGRGKRAARRAAPRHDPKLYDMPTT